MNKFSAEEFLQIGTSLGSLSEALRHPEPNGFPDIEKPRVHVMLHWIADQCQKIALIHAHRASRALGNDSTRIERGEELRIRLEELQKLIHSEMAEELFLWVPGHRSEWYSKNAESLVGDQCCTRFSRIVPELEEAMKCYAVGRFTAAAFHLMRGTEAAVKALGLAIGMTPSHPGWKDVFNEIWRQYNATPANRHSSWATHGSFLRTVSANLRAVSTVWRNDIAHFVETYTEEQARPMFEIIAAFLRDLATGMDEAGTLYP